MGKGRMKTSKIPPKRPLELEAAEFEELLGLAIKEVTADAPILTKEEKRKLNSEYGILAREYVEGGGDATPPPSMKSKGGSIQKKARGGSIDYRKTGMFYGGGMAKKKKK